MEFIIREGIDLYLKMHMKARLIKPEIIKIYNPTWSIFANPAIYNRHTELLTRIAGIKHSRTLKQIPKNSHNPSKLIGNKTARVVFIIFPLQYYM